MSPEVQLIFLKLTLLAMIVAACIYAYHMMKHHSEPPSRCNCSNIPQEKFVHSTSSVTPSGAGGIVGQRIMTDQMSHVPSDTLVKQVADGNFLNDGEASIGVASGNGFDTIYNNHLDIQAIDSKADKGYQQRSDLSEISSKIASAGNNANNNLYSRAGSTPTKLYIAPNEARCVIDERYVPDRTKNKQISTVGTIIPVQGYDVNTDRLGDNLSGTHFSNTSNNKKKRRVPTAAGATVGTDVKKSPNADAIVDTIATDGKTMTIKDGVGGADVTTELESKEEQLAKLSKKDVKANGVMPQGGEGEEASEPDDKTVIQTTTAPEKVAESFGIGWY